MFKLNNRIQNKININKIKNKWIKKFKFKIIINDVIKINKNKLKRFS